MDDQNIDKAIYNVKNVSQGNSCARAWKAKGPKA